MCGEWNSSRDYQLPNLSGSPSGHFWSWPTSWRVRGLWLRWGRQNDLGEHPILLLISYDSWFMMYIYIYIYVRRISDMRYQCTIVHTRTYLYIYISYEYKLHMRCVLSIFLESRSQLRPRLGSNGFDRWRSWENWSLTALALKQVRKKPPFAATSGQCPDPQPEKEQRPKCGFDQHMEG